MIYFQDIGRLWGLLSEMFSGTWVSLQIWGLTLIFALPLGMVICLMYVSKNSVFKWVAKIYIIFFRGTPLLLQVIFVFLGIPLIVQSFGGDFTFARMTAAILAFVLNYAAYFAEIYRGGILAIPKGQYEASHVLGLSPRLTFTKITLPQVVKNIIPPMGNEFITLIKDTALVYAIAINDLLREAKIAMLRDFNFMPLIIAAVFYLVMTAFLTYSFSRFENKFSYYN